eukprot:807352-Prorocentrum_minimum.AAC.1
MFCGRCTRQGGPGGPSLGAATAHVLAQLGATLGAELAEEGRHVEAFETFAETQVCGGGRIRRQRGGQILGPQGADAGGARGGCRGRKGRMQGLQGADAGAARGCMAAESRFRAARGGFRGRKDSGLRRACSGATRGRIPGRKGATVGVSVGLTDQWGGDGRRQGGARRRRGCGAST